MKICAILPIKHISERVPGKNYRDFNGNPLFTIILNILLHSNYIDLIVIDTNSNIIKNTVKNNYSNEILNNKIIIYNRPLHLHPGHISMNIIIENVIQDLNLEYDIYLQTHTTNPLISIETIDNSIITFFEKFKDGYDSLFSVKKYQTRLYKNTKIIEAVNHNINELIPTQNLEPLYEENSCIYIFSKEVLLKKNNRIGYNPYMYIMNNIESIDIDTEADFIVAESLYSTIKNTGIILITGVAGDIGNSLAKYFKLRNWKVYGIDKNEYSDNNVDVFFKCDLTNPNEIEQVFKEINKNENKLDCIINNAALQICKPVWNFDINEWNDIYNCNIRSIFLNVKYGLELLKKSTNPNIINISSVHSICTSDEIACYASSKAGIIGLTRNLAIELGKFNIRVNCISPGAIETKMLKDGLSRDHAGDGNIDERLNNLSKSHILSKIGQPINISKLAYHIINNNFIMGSNIVIDGGASIKLSTES